MDSVGRQRRETVETVDEDRANGKSEIIINKGSIIYGFYSWCRKRSGSFKRNGVLNPSRVHRLDPFAFSQMDGKPPFIGKIISFAEMAGDHKEKSY